MQQQTESKDKSKMDYRPNDRIRVTYEGKADKLGMVWGGDNTGWVGVTQDAVVEVIELAAHPSRDEVGSIRSGLYGTLPLVKVGPDQWVQLTKGEGGIEVVSDDDMEPNFSERELLGVVPGSPAAEARTHAEADCGCFSVRCRD